jgi:vancomycin resistance protein YoaR
MCLRGGARLPKAIAALWFVLCLLVAPTLLFADPAQPQPVQSAPQPSSQPAQQPATTPTPVAPPAPPTASQALDVVMSLGDGKRTWRPTRREMGIFATPTSSTPGSFELGIDPVRLRAYLAKLANEIHQDAVPAHLTMIGPNAHNDPLATISSSTPIPAKIVPAVMARKLDIDGAAAAIRDSIATNPDAVHIVIPVITNPVPDTSAKFAGIDARIAHFVTPFNPGEVGRTQTVRKAIDLIDGTIVAPGATFSLNDTVGERTARRGFGTGIVFVDGHLDTQLGGGMCQVATTLFNAVLLADLKVVERHQHDRTIPYVDPGQDATVYWGQKDFKFENDTKTPIYISYRTTAMHAICDIYGRANPSIKVDIVDRYRRLGRRHYVADLRRYVSANGKTSVNFETRSSYKWTKELDYTF